MLAFSVSMPIFSDKLVWISEPGELGSRRIALNCMLPRRSRTSNLSMVDCLGARREEISTVTVVHLRLPEIFFNDLEGPGEDDARSEAMGIQWRWVPGAGSGVGVVGDTCKNTEKVYLVTIEHSLQQNFVIPNGDSIMSKRFPREVVISRSSSCPMSIKSFSARSMPISSQVCLMAK